MALANSRRFLMFTEEAERMEPAELSASQDTVLCMTDLCIFRAESDSFGDVKLMRSPVTSPTVAT